MSNPKGGLMQSLQQKWMRMRLTDTRFQFMFDAAPDQEWVCLDTETTGLNVETEEIIAVGAVRIVGNRILTSERLELLIRPEKKVSEGAVKVHRIREQDLSAGLKPEDAMERLLNFIGSRPLVGYFLEFDEAMVNKTVRRMMGIGLPQPKIEVSSMYYEYKTKQLPHHLREMTQIDLRFASMMKDLALPLREAHDAINDAVMTGMAFIKLRNMLAS
ncbi:MAG: 3'-5' exonuclease [Burkholderiaceae bacterium]|nr:3'-5' exonuclease [Burkholderiaceae bacterium]